MQLDGVVDGVGFGESTHNKANRIQNMNDIDDVVLLLARLPFVSMVTLVEKLHYRH